MSEAAQKKAALKALEKRREANKGRTYIDNASLVAGSPMYFYCLACDDEIEMPEDYIPPRPKLCEKCQVLKEKGWWTAE